MTLRLLVTRRWPSDAEKLLADRYDVTLNGDDRPLTPHELNRALDDFDVVLPTVTDKLDAAVLGTGPRRTTLLCNFGAGYDHIDLDRCRELGISVSNTPDVLTEATADVALLLMLSAVRGASSAERLLRARRWTGWAPTAQLGLDLRGRTLGLIGFGRIAQAFAAKAKAAFDMKIAYHAPRRQPREVEESLAASYKPTLEQLLEEGDVISVHCPSSPATENLINGVRIDRMKRSAVLINTARGSIVDDEALIDALENRRIWAAGLDVFRGEPDINPRYLELENVALLPHLGSATEETRHHMAMRAIENMELWMAGQQMRDQVI